jgi:hypothetical protein
MTSPTTAVAKLPHALGTIEYVNWSSRFYLPPNLLEIAAHHVLLVNKTIDPAPPNVYARYSYLRGQSIRLGPIARHCCTSYLLTCLSAHIYVISYLSKVIVTIHDQRCCKKNSTEALNAPSLPALTLSLERSPRTAKPCSQPSKYSRLYPGVNFPPPRISSAFACASRGNCLSTVQELIRRGALEIDAYFWLGGISLLYRMRKTVAPQGLQGSSEAMGVQQRSTE